jgi:type I restriction-modification system DNA methylase subunit/restriction endonuclease S subunit
MSIQILLSKNKGELALPASPRSLPKVLAEKFDSITAAELKKLCDAWKISRKGKPKIKDLQDAIRAHFADASESDEDSARDVNASETASDAAASDSDSDAEPDSIPEPPSPVKKQKKGPVRSAEEKDDTPAADPSGNSIVSCVNACHDILRNECALVGEKAMHDIMRLLFLKFLEPLIDSGAVDILDPSHYSVKADQYYVDDMQLLAKFSKFRAETGSTTTETTKDLWKSILCVYPLTSEVFKSDDSWNCSQVALVLLINKIEKALTDSKFSSLTHDIKGRLYEEFLNGYSNGAGQAFGQFFTTRDYIRLIFSQIPEHHAERLRSLDAPNVLDPCMGTAGFLTETLSEFANATIKGCEIEVETYTYALMNVILTTGTLVRKNFARGDSLIALDPREKFDFIPTNPPYGTKMKYEELQKKYDKKWGELKDDENFPSWSEICPVKTNDGVALFLQYIAFKLTPGGIAVVIIPNGQIMFGKNFGKLRKYLLTQVEIPQIMYTPSGVFKHTGVKTAVLWMRKFLDAEAHSGQTIKFMETAKDLSAPTHIAEISPDQLAKNNWSWDASYYKSQETPELAGCEWKPLGEICEFIGGVRRNVSEGTENGEYVFATCSIYGLSKINHCDFDNPALVINSINGSGRCTIYLVNNYCLTSNNFHFRPVGNRVMIRYIYSYLYSNIRILEDGFVGTNQKKISKRYLETLKIPVPSLEIQEKIVKELDELEACKEATRAAIKSQKLVLDKFRRHSNPPFSAYADQIEWKPLGEVCEIAIGGTPLRANPDYWNGTNIWVSISDLNGREIFDSKEKITDLGVSKSSAKLVKQKSILMSFKLSIGKMGIAGCDLYTNEAIVAINPRQTLSYQFVFYFLAHNQSFNPSGSIGGGNLNKESIRGIKIPVPPLEIQEEFVKFYEAKEAKIKKMEADIANAEAQIIDIDALGRTIIEDLIRM